MTSTRTVWLLVLGVLCVASCAVAQDTAWEKANDAGVKALQEARYAEAEQHLTAALKQAEKFGEQDARLATNLNNLATLYINQGKYAEAEPLFGRALAVWEKALGPEHPQVATGLNNLGALYMSQGKYAEAEPLLRRALAIMEKALGPEHLNVALVLISLATLYVNQSKYAEAEPLFQRALPILEKALGLEHPQVATSLNNLAGLYDAQGKYTEADYSGPLRKRPLRGHQPQHLKASTPRPSHSISGRSR